MQDRPSLPFSETISLVPWPEPKGNKSPPDSDVAIDDSESTWWARYWRHLQAGPMSSTALSVLVSDCRYIVEQGVFGAGSIDDGSWPQSRVRRGVVVGAVQSGKTASMLGVSALSLDAGVDVIVILGGTRIALWRQTFDRYLAQLDPNTTGVKLDRQRTLLPSKTELSGADLAVPLSQLYSFNAQSAQRAIKKNRPFVAVVLKNVHHLQALASNIHEKLIPAIGGVGRPIHMLVLDDEADDGSILDSIAEAGTDPSLDHLKQIPRAIVDLWDSRPHSGTSASPDLFVTYVGYTATPQANFLQLDHNPLSPQDFVIALRTPLDVGRTDPRSTTFTEPEGLHSYYSGGETFYNRVAGPSLLIETKSDPGHDLADSVRAFLVAGAVLQWREPSRLTLSEARSTSFATRDDAMVDPPKPHSMLFHPSASVSDHFDAAAELLMWAGDMSMDEAFVRLANGVRSLPAETLVEQLLKDEDPWRSWLDKYAATARSVQDAFGLEAAPLVPDQSDWATIRDLLINEIIPETRISIINSDPQADDRPEFSPLLVDGVWHAPRDLSTIFIAGNVMSRGLTLEGLSTTLFLRHTDDPYADTQAQMQRWFGYRGPYLDLVRVFAPAAKIELFRAYHEADEALRKEIVAAMNSDSSTAPKPTVIQGPNFHATGKLTNVGNVPLWPGAAPFVRLVNDGADEDPNTELVAKLFESLPSRDVVVHGRLSGRILDKTMSLLEAARIFDSLRYERYKPGSDGWQVSRWKSLEAHLGIAPSSEVDDAVPFYRPPPLGPNEPASEVRSDCPYALGAYLRLWHASLTRRAGSLFSTEDSDTPWSMVDLSKKQAEQPRFNVGIRYGSAPEVDAGPIAKLDFKVRPMQRAVTPGGELIATWGSRNESTGDNSYVGDDFFDYYARNQTPPVQSVNGGPRWRPPGSPGLILFHVIADPAKAHLTTTLGAAVPLGGPDQFAARTQR